MRRRILAAMSGGWNNPYVTDGLVAMWDGEWNAGGGKHLVDADYIEDLSGNGNRYMIFSKSSQYTLLEKAIKITDVRGLEDDGARIRFVDFESFTAEVVCNIFGIGDGNYPKLLTANKDFITGSSFDDASFYVSNYNGLLYVKSGEDSYRPTLQYENGYHAYTIRNELLSMYQNGIATSVAVPLRGSRNNRKWIIGSDGYGKVVNETYCTRIYNRALTPTEIAANYAIDRARFGLP